MPVLQLPDPVAAHKNTQDTHMSGTYTGGQIHYEIIKKACQSCYYEVS